MGNAAGSGYSCGGMHSTFFFVISGILLPLAVAVVVVGWAPAVHANDAYIQDNIGVLVYTHGIPSDPLAHQPASDRITAIETYLETEHSIVSEKITHMPYWWNNGLLSLDKNEKEYVIFLYTDMFGPASTVIHDLTRGYFAGMDGYTCPPFPHSFGEPLNAMPAIIDARVMASPFAGDNIFRPMFEQMQIDIDHMLEQYGHVCWFMGHVHVQAETFSEAKIILAEPARPDHPILREIFVKQAAAATISPENDLLVIVGHGARNDSHNDAQYAEMSCAAEYVENRLGFADSTALIVREDWEHLSGPAVAAGIEKIHQMLSASGAGHVTLIHATGTVEGLSLVTDVLDEAGVSYTIAPNGDVLGEEEMIMWAEQTINETIDYIKNERPLESTTTPHWDRTYVCEAEFHTISQEVTLNVNVYHDINNNGIDDDESGFAGYVVDVHASATGIQASAVTGDQGSASITLTPTDWLIALNIPEGYEPSAITFVKISGEGTAIPALLVAHEPRPGSVWYFEIGLIPN